MGDVVIKLSKAAQQQKKSGKRPNRSPARKRYWNGRHLEKTKVRHMMKAYGLTEPQAKKRWHAERKGRIPTGYVSDYSGGTSNTHKKVA